MVKFECNDVLLLGVGGCHYRLPTCEKTSNGTLKSLFTMISIWLKEKSFKVELRDLIKFHLIN